MSTKVKPLLYAMLVLYMVLATLLFACYIDNVDKVKAIAIYRKEITHLKTQKDLRSHSIYKYQQIEKSNDEKEIAFLKLDIDHLRQMAVMEGNAYVAEVSDEKLKELSYELMEKQKAEYDALKKELGSPAK